ncbi:MAG: hypothetical protein NXI24_00020 [bacterium]|nr:hypothetical protein [bacterium]
MHRILTFISNQQPRPLKARAIAIIALAFLLSIGACKQETFEPVAEPQVLLLADPEASVEILQQPLKPETMTWNGRAVESLEIEGTLTVEYDDTVYYFLQLTCPPELKCNGSKAYVPGSLVYGFENDVDENQRYNLRMGADAQDAKESFAFETVRPFRRFTSANLEAAQKTREWLRNPGSELPEVTGQWDAETIIRMIDSHLFHIEDDLERERRIAEYYYLSVSHQESLRNKAFAPYLKNYRAYPGIIKIAAGASAEDSGFSQEQLAFLSALHGYSSGLFDEQAKNTGYDFPFQAKNFGDLAKVFNTRLTLPLYRAMIFEQILNDAPYEAVPAADSVSDTAATQSDSEQAPAGNAALATADTAAVKADATNTPVVNVLFDLEFGAVVKYKTTSGSTEERIFPGIRAKAHENGLAFDLSTADGEKLSVRPLQLSSFLAAANPSKLKEFRKLSDDDIMAPDSFEKRAMLTALKYGVGEYDRAARRFRFELKMDDPKVYWKVLALFKSSPAIGVYESSVYKGTLTNEYGEGQAMRWYQTYDRDIKYSSLKVSGRYEECGRECFTVEVDQVCFDNTEASRVVIEFPGKNLTLDLPEDVNATVRIPEDVAFHSANLCSFALGGAEIEGIH